jgi:hypothetical protein
MEKLGAMSTDDIAKLLKEEGIQGARRVATRCPIARFLHEKTGTVYSVGLRTYRRCDDDDDGHLGESVQLPLSVAQFVTRFDAMRFPELEEEDPRWMDER